MGELSRGVRGVVFVFDLLLNFKFVFSHLDIFGHHPVGQRQPAVISLPPMVAGGGGVGASSSSSSSSSSSAVLSRQLVPVTRHESENRDDADPASHWENRV